VLFINYRGSTGLGKDYVESLLGKIGDADVKDVYNAVQSNPLWSNRKLVLYGGSHGGFLVTQLSGQYPVSTYYYREYLIMNSIFNLNCTLIKQLIFNIMFPVRPCIEFIFQ